ncbi:MAG: universal stress protein [Fluviicola sp.]|nr:universal stress protein [Fluviicola sp.]
MKDTPLYLVPFDFTPVSESALRLGLDLAIAHNGKVTLLNVVKKQSEKKTTKTKFSDYVKTLSKEEQEMVQTRVLIGDLFDSIGIASDLLQPSLIVLGTHGAKGFQKIFGSNIVKMISHSSSPFLVTQGKKTVEKINTIVMPFSFDKKTIQITNLATKIAKKFDATIHLVGYHDKDEWLEKHMKSNQLIVRKHLEDNGIKYVIANIPAGSNYEQGLMNYAQEQDADLMAAGYYQDGIIKNPNSFIQSMIENELHLPLLTVNAEELGVSTGNIVTAF